MFATRPNENIIHVFWKSIILPLAQYYTNGKRIQKNEKKKNIKYMSTFAFGLNRARLNANAMIGWFKIQTP